MAERITQELHDTLVQIQIAPDSDRKNGIPIKAASIKSLQKYQLLFVTLRKLDRRASMVKR